MISLIVAVSANGVIGVRGELPWHLPDDFAWFRKVTMGKPVVMGRKTWESIGKPLPGRSNIVLTRQTDFIAEGAVVVNGPDHAIAAAGEAGEIVVIGGGELYEMFRSRADRVYMTRVDVDLEGDTFFAPLDEDEWSLESSDSHAADERHAHAFEIRVYER